MSLMFDCYFQYLYLFFFDQPTRNASLQWLKLTYPYSLNDSGDVLGLAIIGIFNGSILNRLESDFLKLLR